EVWAEVVRFGDCRPLLHSGAGLLASAVIGSLRSSRSLRWSESESEADAVQGLSLDATDRARPPAARRHPVMTWRMSLTRGCSLPPYADPVRADLYQWHRQGRSRCCQRRCGLRDHRSRGTGPIG